MQIPISWTQRRIVVQPRCDAIPLASSSPAFAATATITRPSYPRRWSSLPFLVGVLLLLLVGPHSDCNGVVAQPAMGLNRAVQYLASVHPGTEMQEEEQGPDEAAEPWTKITTYYGEGSPGNVDDLPLVPVSLPFLFPFNGRPHTRLYISPNGALHFSPRPLCCDSVPGRDPVDKCYMTTRCDLESSYAHMIAAFLADLDAGARPDAEIAFVATKQSFKVRWLRVPFFRASSDTDPTVSFQVELFPDGGALFRLIDVRPPPAELSMPWLAAALRFDYSRNDNLRSDPEYVESPERRLYDAQARSWDTTRAGAYIYREAPPSDSTDAGRSFVSNSTVAYCPVSVNWCVSPQSGSVMGGQELHLIATDLTCFTPAYGHEAQCRFYPCEPQPDAYDGLSSSSTGAAGPSDSWALYSSTGAAGPMAPPASEPNCTVASESSFVSAAASYDPVTRSLRCTVPPASSFAPPASIDASAQRNLVQVRLFDTDFAIELVSSRPLLFTYLSPEAAAANRALLPTPSAPGPEGEATRLLQLGVNPLLCSDCAHLEAPFCARDCAGVFAGVAVVDDCGVCSGGTSNQSLFNGDMDCAGRCFSSGRPRSASFSNRSYCTCSNTSVSATVQSLFLSGLPMPQDLFDLLAGAQCPTEEHTDVDHTLDPIHLYQFALMILAAAGFALIAANKRVGEFFAACCCGAGGGAGGRRRRRHDGAAAEPLADGHRRDPESLSPAERAHDAMDAPSLRPRRHSRSNEHSRSHPYSLRPTAAAAAGASSSHAPGAASAPSTASAVAAPSGPLVAMPLSGVGTALVGQSGSSPSRPVSSEQVAHPHGAVRFHT